MTDKDGFLAPIFIDAPRHPSLQSLFAYWTLKRGSRLLPSRADIQPAEIKPLLPDVMIYNVGGPSGPFIVRLMGENVVNFTGRNRTGYSVTDGKSDDATAAMNAVLAQVVETKTPRFRAGKAFWQKEKAYRKFESCFLPLSPDGESVDMILGGIKFDTGPPG
jgi:hypothetical protein